MIDIRKLKELVRLMVANDLTEMDLRDSEEQVTLRRPSPLETPTIVQGPIAPASPPATASPNGAAGDDAAASAAASMPPDSELVRIESPMVGTFYSAPNPDSSVFVSPGSSVGPETVICIIEAMKIFNEIKAECQGVIEKVLVKNGEAIEFGQPLFLVRPD